MKRKSDVALSLSAPIAWVLGFALVFSAFPMTSQAQEPLTNPSGRSDEEEWAIASKYDDLDYYRYYLAYFPHGKHWRFAKVRSERIACQLIKTPGYRDFQIVRGLKYENGVMDTSLISCESRSGKGISEAVCRDNIKFISNEFGNGLEMQSKSNDIHLYIEGTDCNAEK